MKRVERDTYGKYHFQQQAVRRNMEQLRKLGDEKVVIFECSQDTQIEDDVQPHPSFGFFRRLSLSDKQSAAPRTKRCKCDEQQKTPVPPTVEHIACHNYKSVLQTQLPLRLADEAVEDKPIEQKDYRQEYRELDGVEEHNVRSVCDAKVRNYSIYRKQLIESEKIYQKDFLSFEKRPMNLNHVQAFGQYFACLILLYQILHFLTLQS